MSHGSGAASRLDSEVRAVSASGPLGSRSPKCERSERDRTWRYDMGLRSRGITAAAVALLLLPLQVQAQDVPSTVAFEGVGFTFDQALGTSVNITQVPGEPPSPDEPFSLGPRHLAFTPYGPRQEGAKVPRPIDAPGVVRFYRTADLTDYDWASRQLEGLTSLLDQRPDLASRTADGDDGSTESLPFVLDGSAGQAIDARAHYVETPQLAGIAYVTVFRQDVYPFAASDFWYTFQGLSLDGAWYVAVDFAIEAGMFPAKVSRKDAKRMNSAKRWARYVDQSGETLNAAAPDAFKPPLTSIDALVESITFEAAPATGS